MSKKIKVLIAIGGTGGHVFPGLNLAKHLLEKNYHVNIVTDKRGYKFIKKNDYLNVAILPSFPFVKKNILKLFISFFLIFYAITFAFIFLIFNRPSIIFGMGGYASFPVCIAASILKIKYIIYENNLVIGKANKYLLPFSKKILVSHKELEGVPQKYLDKIYVLGNIINKEIINFKNKNSNVSISYKINLLVLGGSQAARIFAETLPEIFLKCSNQGIPITVYQHCLPSQNDQLSSFYKKNKIDFEIFNFKNNLLDFFSKVNLAITRSGSSVLAELTNVNVPFISIPLPSSADNHQLKNAIYYKNKNYGFLVEEKDLNNKLFELILEIYREKTNINKILLSQSQYSDKNVYNNISKILKEIINEKN